MVAILRIRFISTIYGSKIIEAFRECPHHLTLFADEQLKIIYLKTTETAESTKEVLRYLIGNLDDPKIENIETDEFSAAKLYGVSIIDR